MRQKLLRKDNDAMKGEWKTENIRNCAGGTDDPSSYKTSMEKKKQKDLFYQFQSQGKKEKIKKQTKNIQHTHKKIKYYI